jgi:hypothetical protein
LFCRLDNDVGTGVHLTPTGIEFDERRLTLGKSTEVSVQARQCCESESACKLFCGGCSMSLQRWAISSETASLALHATWDLARDLPGKCPGPILL